MLKHVCCALVKRVHQCMAARRRYQRVTVTHHKQRGHINLGIFEQRCVLWITRQEASTLHSSTTSSSSSY
jgi:hypothetical protein